MKQVRVPAVPLIVNDPYFSIWSPADKLHDVNTQNWTGHENKLLGYVEIDQKEYIFMGDDKSTEKIDQVGLDITPTQTHYRFKNEKIELNLSFISHIILGNLESVSEPFTYLRFKVKSLDGCNHDVKIRIEVDSKICYEHEELQRVVSDSVTTSQNKISLMGKAKQSPLNSSGDLTTIDWGNLYLATAVDEDMSIRTQNYESLKTCLGLELSVNFPSVLGEIEKFAIIAYDDLQAINYFGKTQKAYWARSGKTMFDLIEEATKNYQAYVDECDRLDEEINAKSLAIGGDDYQLICALSYRQAISAHKLIVDENDEVIFLSKECSSNGCIGTVDVSYPSIPLFLLYNPELVKGMLRPIFKFAELPIWPFEFAPHDVGRYPFACGQVYGMKEPDNRDLRGLGLRQSEPQPMLHEYPKEMDIYEFKYQMPIEECGNMLIMTSLVYLFDQDIEFINDNITLLKQWADYLVEHAGNPGDQLCTDDFAGHLENNANLAVKGIVAIRLFAKILTDLGDETAIRYKDIAHEMAKDWEQKALCDDYSKLTFDQEDSWSLKYNMVWDYLLGLNLFRNDIFAKEVAFYQEKTNRYGVPLDCRKTYTKSDWLVWSATMTSQKEDFEKLIAPLARYIKESPVRVPYSDWYDTVDATVPNFKNRTVQGAMFLPFLKEKFKTFEL